MKRLKYLIKRILRMDYGAMLRVVGQIHRKTGKNRLWLFVDMVRCGTKYGAGYSDYRLCEFYNLTPEQRATYVTRGVNNAIVAKLNSRDSYPQVEDKTEFNTLFAEFLGRGWLNMSTADEEKLAEFMQDREVIISKPTASTCGKGVEKLYKSDFADIHALYEHLRAEGSGLIEDCLDQHGEVSEIYPHSINTLRIVTVIGRDGKPHVVYAFIRIGNGGRFVDNINAGGMAAPIRLEDGVIEHAAFDKDSNYYDTHPMTNCAIVGRKLPFWKESLAMCEKAATMVDGLGYVGWDIAVTPDGPVLIEGNHFPGHDILQMPPHVPDKIGMLPRFREFIDI